MRRRIEISKKLLERLYYKEKKSKYVIGKICNCSFKTVLNRMREHDMKPLSRSEIQNKYEKNDFSGNKIEKAYILGFRLGDLNVYKVTKKSEFIVVRCNTTNNDQLNLIEGVFKKYGKVSWPNKESGPRNVNCFLNNTFEFLLPKKDFVQNWITNDINCSSAFAAGYIDAEGNIGIYDGRARFKVDSYDKNVIFWLYDFFKKNNVECPIPSRIGKKNQIYNKTTGYKYNKDLWRIRVSNMESLTKLLHIIKPYLKHKKRITDLNNCLKNINERQSKKC